MGSYPFLTKTLVVRKRKIQIDQIEQFVEYIIFSQGCDGCKTKENRPDNSFTNTGG